MAIEISADQRNALFRILMLELSAFEDLQRAYETGHLESAFKIGRRIADAIRLIVDGGLGWMQTSAEPTTLDLPPDELRAIFRRLRTDLTNLWESERADREETENEWAEVGTARQTCDMVLEQIP